MMLALARHHSLVIDVYPLITSYFTACCLPRRPATRTCMYVLLEVCDGAIAAQPVPHKDLRARQEGDCLVHH
jgi:hypothetical protein